MQTERSRVGVVFYVSAAFGLAFILWGAISPERNAGERGEQERGRG
jgi:hypothetical protein